MTDVSRRLVEIFFATTELRRRRRSRRHGRRHPVRRVGSSVPGSWDRGLPGRRCCGGCRGAAQGRGSGESRQGPQGGNRYSRRTTRPPSFDALGVRTQARLSVRFGVLDGFAGADIVIEAVFEELGCQAPGVCGSRSGRAADTVLATNTSTLPIHEIATATHHPDRILGMHFFSPVEKMPLLEVIPTDRTSADAIVTAVQFGRRMGKTVIVVADSPGFWVNRISCRTSTRQDSCLKRAFRSTDRRDDDALGLSGGAGGVDRRSRTRCRREGGESDASSARRPARAVARHWCDAGRRPPWPQEWPRILSLQGRGTRRGLTAPLSATRRAAAQGDVDEQQVLDRLVYAMLNEAALAMSEGVVRTPRDGDVGALFGIGYPAFRGGPLRTVDAIGAAEVVAKLERSAARRPPLHAGTGARRDGAHRSTLVSSDGKPLSAARRRALAAFASPRCWYGGTRGPEVSTSWSGCRGGRRPISDRCFRRFARSMPRGAPDRRRAAGADSRYRCRNGAIARRPSSRFLLHGESLTGPPLLTLIVTHAGGDAACAEVFAGLWHARGDRRGVRLAPGHRVAGRRSCLGVRPAGQPDEHARRAASPCSPSLPRWFSCVSTPTAGRRERARLAWRTRSRLHAAGTIIGNQLAPTITSPAVRFFAIADLALIVVIVVVIAAWRRVARALPETALLRRLYPASGVLALAYAWGTCRANHAGARRTGTGSVECVPLVMLSVVVIARVRLRFGPSGRGGERRSRSW